MVIKVSDQTAYMYVGQIISCNMIHWNISETQYDIINKIKSELSQDNYQCWETTLGGQGVEASVEAT